MTRLHWTRHLAAHSARPSDLKFPGRPFSNPRRVSTFLQKSTKLLHGRPGNNGENRSQFATKDKADLSGVEVKSLSEHQSAEVVQGILIRLPSAWRRQLHSWPL
jgi:hypothetical protein